MSCGLVGLDALLAQTLYVFQAAAMRGLTIVRQIASRCDGCLGCSSRSPIVRQFASRCDDVIPLDAKIHGNSHRRVALLIGVDSYESSSGFEILDSACKDALKMADVLKLCGFETMILLDGTKDDILSALKKWIDSVLPLDACEARESKSDFEPPCIVVHFAGHGLSEMNQTWFAPVDARRGDVTSCISVEAALGMLPQGTWKGCVIIIADCCREASETDRKYKVWQCKQHATAPVAFLPSRLSNVSILYACRDMCPARVNEDQKCGYLTEAFVHCLLEHPGLTLLELIEKVINRCARRTGGQIPVCAFYGSTSVVLNRQSWLDVVKSWPVRSEPDRELITIVQKLALRPSSDAADCAGKTWASSAEWHCLVQEIGRLHFRDKDHTSRILQNLRETTLADERSLDDLASQIMPKTQRYTVRYASACEQHFDLPFGSSAAALRDTIALEHGVNRSDVCLISSAATELNYSNPLPDSIINVYLKDPAWRDLVNELPQEISTLAQQLAQRQVLNASETWGDTPEFTELMRAVHGLCSREQKRGSGIAYMIDYSDVTELLQEFLQDVGLTVAGALGKFWDEFS